jgi:hypothetical protein
MAKKRQNVFYVLAQEIHLNHKFNHYYYHPPHDSERGREIKDLVWILLWTRN